MNDEHWSLALAVQQAAHRSAHALGHALAEQGMAPSEVNVVANLDRARELTVSQLAGACGVRPSTLTGLLDRLEDRGLLTRNPAPHDRRALLVALTADGRRTARTVRHAVADLDRRALGELTADQVTALRTALEALTGAAS
jgi:MarR family transcriptional regulator, organic hydroperoxide resistance regulator